MQVKVCKGAGFCYGIQRAVDMLESILENGEKVCCLGELLHNPKFMETLAERGVLVVDEPSQTPPGYRLLVRSHGVGPQVYEEINRLGLPFADATCPSVAKIHRLAASLFGEGEIFLLAGDANHPEIKGIIGHCRCRCFVFKNTSELENLLATHPDFAQKHITMAAQTTFSLSEWKNSREIIKIRFTNADIFDTICNATNLRQQQAEEMARRVNKMIVIGGRQSSNTAKLFEICSRLVDTVWIEGAWELNRLAYADCAQVGITAGASTPIKNIMEVVHKMNDEKNTPIQPEATEFNFEQALEESFKRLNKQDTIKGIVTAIYPTEVAVDIGRKQSGYIPLDELTNDPSVKPSDVVKVGDEVDLIVLKTNDIEGVVMLSKRRAEASTNWKKIVEAKDSREVLNGYAKEIAGNNAGVIVMYEGCRVFIPASQTGIPKEGDLTTLLKQKVDFIIIDVEEGRRKRAVGSIRAASGASRKEASTKFWDEAKVGDVISGKVRSITTFGVFVNLGGPDGLIHRSEVSWDRSKKAEDVFAVGDTVEVFIKALDPEKKRISLGYRKDEDNPFFAFLKQFNVGETVSVKITSLVPYGAFAEIIPGVEGLIHISNLSDKPVTKVADVLKKGQTVDAKITEINAENQKISLSIRALLITEETPAAE